MVAQGTSGLCMFPTMRVITCSKIRFEITSAIAVGLSG